MTKAIRRQANERDRRCDEQGHRVDEEWRSERDPHQDATEYGTEDRAHQEAAIEERLRSTEVRLVDGAEQKGSGGD